MPSTIIFISLFSDPSADRELSGCPWGKVNTRRALGWTPYFWARPRPFLYAIQAASQALDSCDDVFLPEATFDANATHFGVDVDTCTEVDAEQGIDDLALAT